MVNENLRKQYEAYVKDESQIIDFVNDSAGNLTKVDNSKPVYSASYVKELMAFAFECYKQLTVTDNVASELESTVNDKAATESKWADIADTTRKNNDALLARIAELREELHSSQNANANAQAIVRERNRKLATIRGEHNQEMLELKMKYESQIEELSARLQNLPARPDVSRSIKITVDEGMQVTPTAVDDKKVTPAPVDDKKVDVSISIGVDGEVIKELVTTLDASAVERIVGASHGKRN